jgi:NAD(P)-dependent dehydrogenase (short-subunit alcohol dehydrogenase family)
VQWGERPLAPTSIHPITGEEATMTLQDRTAVVTGAASGIGRATAQMLAARGAAVAAIDLDQAAAQESVRCAHGVGRRKR